MCLRNIISLKASFILKLKLDFNKKTFSYDLLKENLQTNFFKRKSFSIKTIFRALSNTPNMKRFCKNS